MNITYYCPDVVCRTRLLEQLFEFSDRQINQVLIRRMRDNFGVYVDGVTNELHTRIQTNVSDITWETR